MAIKIGSMAREIARQLGGYGIAVGLEVERVVDDVAEETMKELQRASPELTGDYEASWTYSKGETKKTKYSKVVHEEKPEYALTHLLEKGHQNRNGGRTPAVVHIEPVEQAAAEKLKREIVKRL